MGRPEKPIDPKAPRRRGNLARLLRMIRDAADLTYAEMAAVVDVSEATLKRAASGETVPKKETALAFSLAAETKGIKFAPDIRGILVSAWRMARMEERGTLHLRAPRPEYIADYRDLSKALEALYERAGAPPLRTVRADSGDPLALPMSTLARIVRRESLPADERQLMAVVHGCGADKRDDEKWRGAWEKLHVAENPTEKEFDIVV